jgi:DNA-binding beta-propeller fold protein YncE
VRFVFKAGGVDYAATLHTFGESATEALLGRIVATLRPARSLRVAARPGAIAVPAGPSSIATRGRFLWVVSTGTIESASPLANRLSRVDPATGAVTPVSGLGIRSVTAAVGPSAVWATYTYDTPDGNFAPPVLARVDPAHPHVISRLRLSRDGSDLPIASAAGPGSVWVGLARATEGSVVRVDPATRRIVARVALPVRPNAVVAALGRLWVAGGATLIAIDAGTSQIVATTRVGPGASAVAAASGALWVAAAGDGTVSRVDARTYRVTARVPLGGPCYGLAASRGTVWAALPGAGTVVRLDARSGRIVRRIDVGGDPLAVAAAGGGGSAWVTMLADRVVLPVR